MNEQESFERHPDFRRFFSNHFYLRFGPGDANITFSQQINIHSAGPQNTIQDLTNITMSWTQLKMLGEFISSTVQAMEREVGPIVSIGPSLDALQRQSTEIVKSFAIRKD